MKFLPTLLKTFLFLVFSFSISYGQSYDDLNTTASVYIKKYEDPTAFIKNNGTATNSKKVKKGDAVYYDISDIDMSIKVDKKANTVDFSGGDNYKFTKIQFTHKQSNITTVSRKIDADYKIDLNKIVPGVYILILSNEKGDIKSEELLII